MQNAYEGLVIMPALFPRDLCQEWDLNVSLELGEQLMRLTIHRLALDSFDRCGACLSVLPSVLSGRSTQAS